MRLLISTNIFTNIITTVLILLLGVSHVSLASNVKSSTPQIATNGNLSSTLSNRLFIKFKKTTSPDVRGKITSSHSLKTLKKYRVLKDISLVEVPGGVNAKEIYSSLVLDPNIEYLEFDRPVYLRAIPNDTQFDSLWALNNTSDADINAAEAWDVTTGDPSVVLAVIDTGIDYTHEDLRENVWVNPNEIPGNGIDDDNNGYIDDVHGIDTGENDSDPFDEYFHGTHVSGTIAARGNNALGITGVNWSSRVLACKIFSFTDSSLESFVSSAVECLDYILDLKVNHGINIVASNNSWGWTGDESQALKEAIQRNADAGILFVAAAGNSSEDNDGLNDYPSTYYLPNIISVAASSSSDSLSYFSNYGDKSVHVAAPGSSILSTLPGNEQLSNVTENPYTDIFMDDNESGTGAWTAESPWSVTATNSYSSFASWTDSPVGNYPDNSNASLISPVIDLSANLSNRLYLGFFAFFEIEDGFDNVYVEMSGDGGTTWIKAGEFTGNNFAWDFYRYIIPDIVKTATFRFRFRLQSDDFINMDGIYIDSIGVGVDGGIDTANSNSYGRASGTSMAAPHVVGVLGLLKANNPALTMMQLKNLIIAGGTPLPEFSENTISGRRLRAYDVDGTGSLSCANQTVFRRLRPAEDMVIAARSGEQSTINISFLNINCDVADLSQTTNGALTATVLETGEVITLLDSGSGFDQLANDGVFSGQYSTANYAGDTLTIVMPDDTSVYVRIVEGYSFTENIGYQWREIAGIGTVLELGDDSGAVVESPFPILYGSQNADYRKLFVSDNGIIALYEQFETIQLQYVPYINEKLPSSVASRIVSPYWFDLLPFGGNIYWTVLGTAPNRELVIQWDEYRVFGASFEDYLTFQVVFFENRSGVVFNYQDVGFGYPVADNGALVTVGVQIHSGLGENFSYRTPRLSNGKSILAYMPGSSTTGYNDERLSSSPGNATPREGAGGGGNFSLFLILAMLFRVLTTHIYRR